MAIGENNLSSNGGAYPSFAAWPGFKPEKFDIEELERQALESENAEASFGIAPIDETPITTGAKAASSVKGRKKPSGIRKPSKTKERQHVPTIKKPQEKLGDYDHHDLKLDIDRPQFKLKPFQERIYSRLYPIKNKIKTQYSPYEKEHLENSDGVNEIDITSSAVHGVSGSGLTTMVSKKAYENYQYGRPTIVLVHREHLMQKMAQTIIDLADKDKRQALKNNIEIVSGKMNLERVDPSKKIYIVSQKKLENYLKQNENHRANLAPTMTMGAKTWRARSGSHKKLASVFPLHRIREILVDQVNKYVGKSNEGRAKVLMSLLDETSNTPRKNPVHLFGTYHDKPQSEEKETRVSSRLIRDKKENYAIELDDLFPAHSKKTTPSPKRLIQEFDHYKKINIDDLGVAKESLQELLSSDALSKDKLSSIKAGSINMRVLETIKEEEQKTPGKKWHIIAHSDNHAKALLKLLNANGVNAKALTSKTNGQYLHDPEGSEKLLDAEGKEVSLKFARNKESSKTIIDEYESDKEGSCNVIIDLDAESCIHSTKTDKVLVLDLADKSELRLKHYLGEAVRDAQGPEDQSIDYIFLRRSILEDFNDFRSRDDFKTRIVKKSSSNSSEARESEAPDHEVTLNRKRVFGHQYHQTWLDDGLQAVLDSRYEGQTLENQINSLVSDFKQSRVTPDQTDLELKNIITGSKKDKIVFREFLKFIESDLKSIWQDEGLILLDTDLDVMKKASFLVPDLVGVKDAATAKLIVAKEYQDLMFNTNHYAPEEKWLERLDGALGINAGEEPEQKRVEEFSKLIFAKYGQKAFEDKTFIKEALEIFTGSLVDYKLFGFLVANLSSNHFFEEGSGFSFSQIRKEFPNLLGALEQVPFERLQRQIIAKYPDGPPADQALSDFFADQLYEDFALDFGTLVHSVSIHSSGTDTELLSLETAEGEIETFLKEIYKINLDRNLAADSPLRPSAEEFKAEIEAKAKANLSPFTRELLYNQLIAKIWGQARSTRIKFDDHVIDINAKDGLKPSARVKQPLEDMLDDFKLNPRWMKSFDNLLNSDKSVARVKSRLATIIGAYLAHKHSIPASTSEVRNTLKKAAKELILAKPENLKENEQAHRSRQASIFAETDTARVFLKSELNTEQKREIQVLSGSIAPENLSEKDRDALRDFAQFYKLPLNTVIAENFQMLGVRSLEEAKIVIKDQLSKIEGSNQSWMNLFGSQDEYLELVSKFIFENNLDIFNHPQSLSLMLKALAGDTHNGLDLADLQSQNRKLIDFANKNGADLKTEEIILNFREQIGLRTKEELFALIRQPDLVNFDGASQSKINKNPLNPNNYRYRNPEGVKKFVEKLAEKLGLSSTELFALADLREPSNFYKEPTNNFSKYIEDKLSYSDAYRLKILAELDGIFAQYSQSINSRQLLNAVFGEQYKHKISKFEIYAPLDVTADSSTGVTMTQILTDENNSKQKLLLSINDDAIRFSDDYREMDSSGKIEWSEGDYLEYKFENDTWQLKEQQQDLIKKYTKLSYLLFNLFEQGRFSETWQLKLGDRIGNNLQLNNEKMYALMLNINNFLVEKNLNLYRNNDVELEKLVSFLIGDQSLIKKDELTDYQTLFREFIEVLNKDPLFTDLSLEQAIKEFPKLTGIENYDELKSAIDYKYPDMDAQADKMLLKKSPLVTGDWIKFFKDEFGLSEEWIENLPFVKTKCEQYISEAKKLDLINPETLSSLESHKDLLRMIFLHKVYPGSRFNYYLPAILSTESGGELHGFNLTISHNKLQYDITQVRDKNIKLINFQNKFLNEQGNWEDRAISDEEFMAREAMMNILPSDVHPIPLPKLSANLNDAYDELLTKKRENNSYFLKTSNLFTEFLLQEQPELFENDDNKLKLKETIMSLIGIEAHKNLALINKFIDFAEAKHPGFDAIRNDPKFKEIFFETTPNISETRANAQKVIKWLQTNMVGTMAQTVFKTAPRQMIALQSLVAQALGQLGLSSNSVSIEDIMDELNIPTNIPQILGQGFTQLANLINTTNLRNNLINNHPQEVARLANDIHNMPSRMPPQRADDFRAHFAFKKLFPDTDFNYSNPASRTLAHLLNFPIKNSDGTDSNMEYNIECDGKTLNFFKRQKRTENFEILASIPVDNSLGIYPNPPVTVKSNAEAIALLRRKYPNGIGDPSDLEQTMKDLNLNFDILKSRFNVDHSITNAREIFTKAYEAHHPRLHLNLVDLSPRQFLDTFFTKEDKKAYELIMMVNAIWPDNGYGTKLDLQNSAYGITFAEGEKMNFNLRHQGQRLEVMTLAKDPETGMYLPYKDENILTMDLGENKLQNLQRVVQKLDLKNLVSNKNQTEAFDSTMSYLTTLTGLSQADLAKELGLETEHELDQRFQGALKLLARDNAGIKKLDEFKKLKNTISGKGRIMQRNKLLAKIFDKQNVDFDFTAKKADTDKYARLKLSFDPDSLTLDATMGGKPVLLEYDYDETTGKWAKVV